MRGLALAFVVGVSAHAQSAPAARASSAVRQPIIDVHLHAHAANRFGTAGLPNPITGRPSSAVTDDALMRAALDVMRRHNIVLGIASSARAGVQRWRTAGAGRIMGGAQLDVGIPWPSVSEIREST